MHVEINYLAVLVAAMVYYAGGALWFSPGFLGKAWSTAAGLDSEKIKTGLKDVWKSHLIAILAALIISYGLARVEAYMQVSDFSGGLHTGFWSWFCYVITTMAINYSFEHRSWKLWLINAGYHLYGFIVMAVILAVWR
jgi:Protein of unknown function (DUF1761)